MSMPIGEPEVLDIWEAAMLSMIETYPEADSYGVWAPEHSTPVEEAPRQALLRKYPEARALILPAEEISRRGNALVDSELGLDNDFAQICVVGELRCERIQEQHPKVKLGVITLFRGLLAPRHRRPACPKTPGS